MCAVTYRRSCEHHSWWHVRSMASAKHIPAQALPSTAVTGCIAATTAQQKDRCLRRQNEYALSPHGAASPVCRPTGLHFMLLCRVRAKCARQRTQEGAELPCMTNVSVHMTVLQQSRLTASAASHSSCQRNYICTPVQCHRTRARRCGQVLA